MSNETVRLNMNQELVREVLKYLATRPFQEVAGLIQAIQQDVSADPVKVKVDGKANETTKTNTKV